MGQYTLVVFTKPFAGREAEFNDWYDNRHLRDVVQVPGFKSAQRLKLNTLTAGQFEYPYLALYEMETDDVAGALDEMQGHCESGKMFISQSLDPDLVDCAVFEIITPKIEAD